MSVTFLATCPICRGLFGGKCEKLKTDKDAGYFDCEACGKFLVSNSLLTSQLSDSTKLTALQQAALAHRVRLGNRDGQTPFINSDWFERFLEAPTIPTPGAQASNIVRFVGDEVLRSGKPLKRLPVSVAPSVGAPSTEFAFRLAKELVSNRVLLGIDASRFATTELLDVDLTLTGWQHYESEKRGKTSGNYGFVALRFGNVELDGLLRNSVKPAMRATIGSDLVDMRDVAAAGVIDNIMRAQIRDAAFVLADLTDDNSGAYWEAGYAEGLGKPVIYLCEAAKFAAARTHFDTNHCTTVLWTLNDRDHFVAELIATLRRSLNLFPGA